MTRALLIFVVLTALVGPIPTFAAETHAPPAKKPPDAASPEAQAITLLSDAAGAVRRVTYRGVIVYDRGGDFDTLKVVHRLHNGVEQERLESESGVAREVIRDGNKVTSILPQHKIVLISQHPHRTLLGSVARFSPSRLKHFYNVRIAGTMRFAGRRCRVIDIVPEDRYRYGYRMLVDSKNDLPLKLLLRYEGNVLEQLMFTSVSFPATVPDNDFLPSYDVRGFKIIRQESTHLSHSPSGQPEGNWQATDLPPGFRLVEDAVRQVTPNASVQQLLFTDGVATVSAFIAPAGLRPPFQGATSLGAVHAYGHIIDHSQITVVGEVPAVTAKQIADHLTPTH